MCYTLLENSSLLGKLKPDLLMFVELHEQIALLPTKRCRADCYISKHFVRIFSFTEKIISSVDSEEEAASRRAPALGRLSSFVPSPLRLSDDHNSKFPLRCCKCHSAYAAHVGHPCTLQMSTVSALLAWAAPKLRLRLLRQTALTTRA